MRKSAGLLIPLTLIVLYYILLVAGVWTLLRFFPSLGEYFPIGGLDELPGPDAGFAPVYPTMRELVYSPSIPMRLLLSCFGAVLLALPVSWVYFISSRTRSIDQSFLQTIMILPVVVAGISLIVANSVALAFSLAGVVAAVRFRFTLRQPSDAMYIFVAIAIGLGSGIGAMGVATVISFAYVMTTLIIWKLEYGKTLSGPFLTMLTRRDSGEDDYD